MSRAGGIAVACGAVLLSLPRAATAVEGVAKQGDNLRDGAGVAAVRDYCLDCHDDSYIVSMNLQREEWEEILEIMVGMGMAPLEGEARDAVLGYLATLQGTDSGGDGELSSAAAGETAELSDLPWAEPRYPPNPLTWHRPR